jgi:MFS family permease
MRSYSRLGLGTVTAATMATGTFPFIIFSVFASELIAEFDISRAQVGLLATGMGMAGAFSAPYFGRVTDRIGSVRATRGALLLGAATVIGIAVSPTYALILLAAVFAGMPNGWSNSAGNALIVDTVPTGERGLDAGIKQSGVQIGAFLGGLLLPVFAGLWSWRVAVAAFVFLPLIGLMARAGGAGAGRDEALQSEGSGRLPRSIYSIAVYGAVSGVGTSAIFAFIPLFAEEDIGWSPETAGLLIAISGFVGFFARILWPAVAERTVGYGRTLRIQGLLSAFSAALLALAASGVLNGWVLVPAAIAVAVGSISWNAVGMLAVMELVPAPSVGRGTGVVLFGFLLGYSIGSPLLGLSVDSFDSYVPGWWAVAGLMLVSSAIAFRIPQRGTLARS